MIRESTASFRILIEDNVRELAETTIRLATDEECPRCELLGILDTPESIAAEVQRRLDGMERTRQIVERLKRLR